MVRLPFIIFLISWSCNPIHENSEQEINFYLTNNSERYWDLLMRKEINFPQGRYFYYFNIEGKFVKYVKYEKGIMKYEIEDIYIPEQWKYISDSSILIGNSSFKILKISQDSFIFSDSKSRRTILVRSKLQNKRIYIDTTSQERI